MFAFGYGYSPHQRCWHGFLFEDETCKKEIGHYTYLSRDEIIGIMDQLNIKYKNNIVFLHDVGSENNFVRRKERLKR